MPKYSLWVHWEEWKWKRFRLQVIQSLDLPVEGIQRKLGFRNFIVLYKLMVSLVQSTAHHKIIQTRCGYWCWRICQRTPAQNGRPEKNTHPDPGTEFLCRGNQPVAGPKSSQNLCCLCGNGKIFSCRKNCTYRKSDTGRSDHHAM